MVPESFVEELTELNSSESKVGTLNDHFNCQVTTVPSGM